ncbi:MAG: NAD-dependent epimerase/dehydratase family protein [Pleurocapsa sp. MO_192.B19]|nr:NAD-dependent epimerase/dehydratase family protein [Pleurocapsa sp. MO_192.B19]
MKIFLTGATGYIGTVVAQKLQAAGYSVVGLARTKMAAQKLILRNIEPFIGDLRSPDSLIQVARQTDGIIHTAFIHDFKNWTSAVTRERKFIATISDALAGSGKPLIVTSDSGVLGDTKKAIADENYPISKNAILACRAQAERDILQASQLDIRTVVLRLPFYVYGLTSGTFLAAMQIKTALEMGVFQYIESGNQQVSTAHVDDVAQLYLLALEKAPAGSLFQAATESGITTKAIAQAIADMTVCDTESICFEEAVFNWGETLATFFSINNQISATKAIQQLGWQPQVGRSLLEEIKTGWYRTLSNDFDETTRLEMLRLLDRKPSPIYSTNSISH